MASASKPPVKPPTPDQLARQACDACGIGGEANLNRIKGAIIQAIVDRDEHIRRAIDRAGNRYVLGHIDVGRWAMFRDDIDRELLLVG